MSKKILLIEIALIFLGLKLSAQPSVTSIVPDYFKKFYKIVTYNGNVLDMQTSGDNNVYHNSYHGGNNQQWLVMPLKPDGSECVIINREGKVLDRHYGGNLYCYSSYHGGRNQIFEFAKKSNGEVIIICDNNKVGDISTSKRHRNPFNHPSSSRGNLYAGTRHEGDNQRFKFVAAKTIPNSEELKSWKLFSKVEEVKIPLPPPPSSLNANTVTSSTPEVHIATTFIPSILCNDGKSLDYKINYSPFYIIKQYTYYELRESYLASALLSISQIFSEKRGVSKSTSISLYKKMKFTHTGDGGINGESNITNTLSAGLTVNTSATTNYEATRTLEVKNVSGEKCRVCFWERMERFEIYRMNSEYPFYTWVVNTPFHEFLTYPENLEIITSESTSKGVDASYKIIKRPNNNWSTDNTTPVYATNPNSGNTEVEPQVISSKSILGQVDNLNKLNSKELTVTVYPNPAKNSFTVNLSQNDNVYLRLFDMQGKIVKELQTKQPTIRFDCSDLKAGLYNLHIHNNNNNTIIKKIIINR